MDKQQETSEIAQLVDVVNAHLRTKNYKPFDFISITYNAALMILSQAMNMVRDQDTLVFLMSEIPKRIIAALEANKRIRESKANGEADPAETKSKIILN